MTGRQRAVVTGVHGLQHVKRFAGTDFADDNAVGAHTQGVAHQIANRNGALTFQVRRAGFQGNHMLLLQTKFSRIFYGNNTFVVRNKR